MRRRTFLKGLGVAATTASAGPLIVTDRTIAQTRTIYVNTWGGSWTAAEEAAFDPFDRTGHWKKSPKNWGRGDPAEHLPCLDGHPPADP